MPPGLERQLEVVFVLMEESEERDGWVGYSMVEIELGMDCNRGEERGGAERGRCLIGEVYELALSGMDG